MGFEGLGVGGGNGRGHAPDVVADRYSEQERLFIVYALQFGVNNLGEVTELGIWV